MGELLYGEAIHIRKQAEIDGARIKQKSGNERRGAETALAQFSSSLANKRALDAAGRNINDNAENIARNLDATTTGNLMARVQAAEELGASTAMAAAAGVGGSSVEAYNTTMRLMRAMEEEGQDRATASDLRAATEASGEMLTDAAATLDNSVYRPNLDYNQYVDHKKMGGFEKMLWLGTAAAATVFGGPQAGMAVVGMAEAKQAANNGDFATASQAQMGAIQNGFSAYKDTRALGKDYWGSTRRSRGGTPTWGQVGHENTPPQRAGTIFKG